MAAFEKNLIGELHGNFSIYLFTTEIVLNLFNERMMLLLCFGVAFNSYLKLLKHSIFQNTSRCVPKDASHQLFCYLENFYASGMQDAELTK